MPQESFRRWQAEAIKQKQTASALLLGLSGATLAFSLSQLTGKSAYIGCWQSLALHTTAITHLFSMTMGVFFSLNRIRDFDLTAMIARVRESEPNAPRLKNMRNTVRRWGRTTRRLLVAQAVSLGWACCSFFG